MGDKPQPFAETSKWCLPDYTVRQRYRLDDFLKVMENEALIETCRAWVNSIEDVSTMTALIKSEHPSPYKWQINKHKHDPGGVKEWLDKPLGSFDGSWGMHYEQCAEDYYWAKDDEEIHCHLVKQRIGNLERTYHRIIWPLGKEILVASAALALKTLGTC